MQAMETTPAAGRPSLAQRARRCALTGSVAFVIGCHTPRRARLAALAAAALGVHQVAEDRLHTAARRLPLAPDRMTGASVTRLEWAAAGSVGGLVLGALYTAVAHTGTRPTLAMPFFVMPGLYAVLAAREHLVLLRSIGDEATYDALLSCASGASVFALLLPPSLSMAIGASVLMPPVLAQWLRRLPEHVGGGGSYVPTVDEVQAAAEALFQPRMEILGQVMERKERWREVLGTTREPSLAQLDYSPQSIAEDETDAHEDFAGGILLTLSTRGHAGAQTDSEAEENEIQAPDSALVSSGSKALGPYPSCHGASIPETNGKPEREMRAERNVVRCDDQAFSAEAEPPKEEANDDTVSNEVKEENSFVSHTTAITVQQLESMHQTGVLTEGELTEAVRCVLREAEEKGDDWVRHAPMAAQVQLSLAVHVACNALVSVVAPATRLADFASMRTARAWETVSEKASAFGFELVVRAAKFVVDVAVVSGWMQLEEGKTWAQRNSELMRRHPVGVVVSDTTVNVLADANFESSGASCGDEFLTTCRANATDTAVVPDIDENSDYGATHLDTALLCLYETVDAPPPVYTQKLDECADVLRLSTCITNKSEIAAPSLHLRWRERWLGRSVCWPWRIVVQSQAAHQGAGQKAATIHLLGIACLTLLDRASSSTALAATEQEYSLKVARPLCEAIQSRFDSQRLPLQRSNTMLTNIVWLPSQQEYVSMVEGLEPCWPNGDGSPPHWRSHVEWFRWFATGDLLVLGVLLALRELR